MKPAFHLSLVSFVPLVSLTSFAMVMFVLAACFALLSTPASAQDTLENTSWQLLEIHSFNDSVFTPRNPESYLLRFRLDNRLQIEADCNQAGATWTREGDSLTLTGLISTRKLCIAPSLYNRFIMNLEQAASITREGDWLILRSSNGVDWMKFEPYVFTPTF